MVDIVHIANKIKANNSSVDAQIIAIAQTTKQLDLDNEQAIELSQLIDDDTYKVWNDPTLRNIAMGVFPSLMTLKKMQRVSSKRIEAICNGEISTDVIEKIATILDEIGIVIIPINVEIGLFIVDIDATYCKFIESQFLQERAAITFSLVNLSFDIAQSKPCVLEHYKTNHTTLHANNYVDVLNYVGCRLNMNNTNINANYWLLNKALSKYSRLELAKLITEYNDAY